MRARGLSLWVVGERGWWCVKMEMLGILAAAVAAKEWVVEATINQDLDLIKSCIEVKRVAACRAAVQD